jgi:hypothetical protein
LAIVALLLLQGFVGLRHFERLEALVLFDGQHNDDGPPVLGDRHGRCARKIDQPPEAVFRVLGAQDLHEGVPR